jgi:hypothetical protein
MNDSREHAPRKEAQPIPVVWHRADAISKVPAKQRVFLTVLCGINTIAAEDDHHEAEWKNRDRHRRRPGYRQSDGGAAML